MGVCEREKISESKKIFNSFNKISKVNKFNYTIENYEENLQKVQSFSKKDFEKLGQMQQLRVDFIQEIREEFNLIKENNYYYKNIDYLEYENQYKNYNYNPRTNINLEQNGNNEIEKILYDIIVMTLTLKSYLRRNYVSNELEKSLLELSIVILKKNYNNKNDLKLVLYYLSRMFEILFRNIQNIQSYININEYVSKIDFIASDYNVLTKEEKYSFILTHIISLGEIFRNDYNKIILINNLNQYIVMKYYIYLIIKNNNFIMKNYSLYKKILMEKNNNYESLNTPTYDKKDLIEEDNFSENIVKKAKEFDDLNKIANSLLYFLILSSEDTFKGKNIFYEFDNQLEFGIKANNLENELDIAKFKETLFMILYINMKNMNDSSTILLSFYEYFCDNPKFGIQNNDDSYNEIFISLYDKFNNKIFIDKYSLLLSRIFVREIENYKKENLILDKLYKYISKLTYSNNEINDLNKDQIYFENLYFLINLIKYISLYYIKLKNIKIAYDILIYLTDFLHKIKKAFKPPEKNIINNNNNNNFQIKENFEVTLNNFDYNKNDFYTSLNDIIQIQLSNFLSIYILLINEFFHIKENNFIKKYEKFDYIIIITITYLEISMIQNKRKKNIQVIIKLLNLYINILAKENINDYENINSNLSNNLRLILKETRFNNNLEIFNQNIQTTSFHIKLIYGVILIILIEINKNNLYDLISKHDKILNTINKYNNSIGFHCFPKIENMKLFNIKKLISFLSYGELHIIQKDTFHHIINIINKILFNEDDEISENIFRPRTVYKRDMTDMIINITTNKEDYYQNKTHNLFWNNINDSFSEFSHNSLLKKTYSNFPQNTSYHNINNSDVFSEKVNLPYKDNNNTFNLSQNNEINDIFSDKNSSDLNFKI